MPTWLVILTALGAIPLAYAGIRLLWKGARRGAHLFVKLETVVPIMLYEFCPNEGDSIKDKVDEALLIGRENQRTLEVHLLEHQET
jgi:hypothetical protein